MKWIRNVAGEWTAMDCVEKFFVEQIFDDDGDEKWAVCFVVSTPEDNQIYGLFEEKEEAQEVLDRLMNSINATS